jgi:hypothetical protein
MPPKILRIKKRNSYRYKQKRIKYERRTSKKYLWIYNKCKTEYKAGTTEDNYILENKNKVRSLIENSDLSTSSKESMTLTIARWFDRQDDNRNYKIFKDEGFKYLEERKDKDKENTLEGEEENFRTRLFN